MSRVNETVNSTADAPKPRPVRAPRNPMPEIDPLKRARTFDEVTLGYDEKTAAAEASRCLKCKNPTCEAGCPVGVRIKDFIAAIIDEDMPSSVEALKERNALPAVCGRVCPQESQCEAACVLAKRFEPVAIGRLERYVADWDRARDSSDRVVTKPRAKTGKRCAVIGSGPAGLACAGELSLLGHDVTVFEAMHAAGGVLRYGIPEFRLPKAILEDEIGILKRCGVKFEFNFVAGKIADSDELLAEGFETIFFGTGAGLPSFLGIEGENYNGVYSANEFLTRINLMKSYQFPSFDTPIWEGHHVVVVGGGNVAMDAARCGLRLGADKVTLVYRRTIDQMPARAEEINHAIDEGVEVIELAAPVIIEGSQGWCTGLRVQPMKLSETDAGGRVSVVETGEDPYTIQCDTIISAIGTRANPLTHDAAPSVELNGRGYVIADDDGRTNDRRIFAGGDIVTGAATVILAMGAGKKAAQAMDNFLANQ